MADERVDVIDKKNNVLGTEMKSVVHEKGLRHRVSAVLVKNADGKYLIPTASPLKVEAGRLFHSSAGHVSSGESYLASAVREVWEECGLVIKESDLKPLGNFWMEKSYPSRNEKERFEVFELQYSRELGLVVLNEEQINETWLSEEELSNIYKESPDRFSYPFRLCFEKILKKPHEGLKT